MYNNFKIFKWNSNKYIDKTNSDSYYDVHIHTGSKRKNEWENPIAVKKINNISHVILDSNSFYQHEESKWQNDTYNIYRNIINNYLQVSDLNTNVDNTYYNDEVYFYAIDCFAFSNSGHNLSDMLNRTKYILSNNIKNIFIFEGYRETNNFKLLELLIPIDCNIIELKFDTIYNVKNIIITKPLILDITLHTDLRIKLQNTIVQKYSDIYNDCKYKNVILMKTTRNSNVMLSRTQFDCPNFLNALEKKGYIYLNPTEMDVFKMCIYLLFANKIVFSTGAILYTNKMFFNLNAQLIFMNIIKDNLLKHDCNIGNIMNLKPLIIHTDKNVTKYKEIVNIIENNPTGGRVIHI